MVKVIYCEDETVLEDLMECHTNVGGKPLQLLDWPTLLHKIGQSISSGLNEVAMHRGQAPTSVPAVSPSNGPAWSYGRKQLVLEAIEMYRAHLWNIKCDPANALNKSVYTRAITECDLIKAELS